MQHNNQTAALLAISDVDRFYILMGPLYGLVDSKGPVELDEVQTLDATRRAMAHRAAKVRAVLRPVDPAPNGDNA